MTNDTCTRPHGATPGTDQTSVYLYYDTVGILLYVGVTSRATSRQAEHNADKVWWPYVARQEIEHYDSRCEALSRESDLISTRRPPFNTQQNPNWRHARAAYEQMRPNLLRDPIDLAEELNWAVSLSIRALPGEGDTGALSVETEFAYRRVFVRTILKEAAIGSRIVMNSKKQVVVRGGGGKVIGKLTNVYRQGAISVLRLDMEPRVTFTSAAVLVDPKRGTAGTASFVPWMVRCYHDRIGPQRDPDFSG